MTVSHFNAAHALKMVNRGRLLQDLHRKFIKCSLGHNPCLNFNCSFLFIFIKAEMSLIFSEREKDRLILQTPQLNAIWMASIFIKKRQYSAQQKLLYLHFLFCLSVTYQVSTVNISPFLFLFTFLTPFTQLSCSLPLPLATTNMFPVSMSLFLFICFF